jgi:hypothetical protein
MHRQPCRVQGVNPNAGKAANSDLVLGNCHHLVMRGQPPSHTTAEREKLAERGIHGERTIIHWIKRASRFANKEEQMAKLEDGHIVETTIKARGAERGPTVRNMLVWGIGLVVAAFVVIYLLYFKT